MAGVQVPESAYATQLAQGFRGLRFVRALEREFQAEFADQHLPRVRLGFAGASVVYLAFLLFRLRIETGAAEHWGLLLRSIAVAGMLLPLVASFVPRLRPWLSFIVPAGYAIFAIGVTGIEIIAPRYGIDRHYEGLILASFHVYVFGGLLLRPALVAGAGIVLAYLVGGAAGGLAGKAWAYQMLFIGLTHVIGGGALYFTERIERENFLRRQLFGALALQDALTGLMNRMAFTSRVESLLKQAARDQVAVGLTMIDIDHFKAYNDRYGHVEGDACLRAVAQAVREEFRRPFDALGRYGGEEFIGLWYDVQPQALRPLAEQVRAAVQACRIAHGDAPSGRVTVSVGAVCCVPAESDSLQALVERADRSLYEAKERGRNRVVVADFTSKAAPARSRRSPTISGAG